MDSRVQRKIINNLSSIANIRSKWKRIYVFLHIYDLHCELPTKINILGSDRQMKVFFLLFSLHKSHMHSKCIYLYIYKYYIHMKTPQRRMNVDCWIHGKRALSHARKQHWPSPKLSHTLYSILLQPIQSTNLHDSHVVCIIITKARVHAAHQTVDGIYYIYIRITHECTNRSHHESIYWWIFCSVWTCTLSTAQWILISDSLLRWYF